MTITTCDACGHEINQSWAPHSTYSVDFFERKGAPVVGYSFKGNLCMECYYSVRYEESCAAMRAIDAKKRERACH